MIFRLQGRKRLNSLLTALHSFMQDLRLTISFSNQMKIHKINYFNNKKYFLTHVALLSLVPGTCI